MTLCLWLVMGWASKVWFPAWEDTFIFLTMSREAVGTPRLPSNVIGGSFPTGEVAVWSWWLTSIQCQDPVFVPCTCSGPVGWSRFDPWQRQRIFPLALVLSPGVKHGQGVMLTAHHHLVPRSRMSRNYTTSPPCASICVLWDCFTCYLYFVQGIVLGYWDSYFC
jgi:hypothetical protein